MKITIPIYRPRTCKQCPLCGKRPPNEMVNEDPKRSYRCLATFNRVLNSNGINKEDIRGRHRCSPRQWRKFYDRFQGEFEISPHRMERYKIQQQTIIFPPN